MDKTTLARALEATGWKPDNFGHYKKTAMATDKATGAKVEVLRRVKFQAISVRLERQVEICGKNEWRPVAHAYIKDVVVGPEGVTIGKTLIKNMAYWNDMARRAVSNG